MPNLRRSDLLRENLAALYAWTNSRSFIGWKAAREKEAQEITASVGLVARDWEHVIELRARAETLISIANSFEDVRQDLEEALNEAIEEETQLATTAQT